MNYIFDDEEYQYINKLTENLKQEQITKAEILASLAFAREIAEQDSDILSLIDGVYSKLNNMSDNEWEEMKRNLPFQVMITAESSIDDLEI